MKLSIVTTLYNSEPYLNEFYERITNTVKNITSEYEIIFVNDGSPDNAIEIARFIHNKDDKVSVIDLSKNFGHHRAMMTGLFYSSGEYVFLIDSDLEEDPELLNVFWNEIRTNLDLDVVYGVQQKRKGKLMEKISGALFFKILNFLSDIKITENLAVVRLMTRRYLNNLLKHSERELAFVGIAALTGFNQKSFPIIKKDKGSSSYNFKKKIVLAINFITSLTGKPLVYIFNLGLMVTSLSMLYLIFLIGRKVFLGIGADGWISIVVSIWLFGGLIIFCLGIMGIYLSKIFSEVKKRPYSIIKAIHSKNIYEKEFFP